MRRRTIPAGDGEILAGRAAALSTASNCGSSTLRDNRCRLDRWGRSRVDHHKTCGGINGWMTPGGPQDGGCIPAMPASSMKTATCTFMIVERHDRFRRRERLPRRDRKRLCMDMRISLTSPSSACLTTGRSGQGLIVLKPDRMADLTGILHFARGRLAGSRSRSRSNFVRELPAIHLGKSRSGCCESATG